MTEPLLVPTAIRGFTPGPDRSARVSPKKHSQAVNRGRPLSRDQLVIDVLIADDLNQTAILFGYIQLIDGFIVDEGLVLPGGSSPRARKLVAQFAASNVASLSPGIVRGDSVLNLRVLSPKEFFDQVFYETGYRDLGTIIGANLDVVLSRMAARVWFQKDRPGVIHLGMHGAPKADRAWQDYPGAPGIRVDSRGEAWQFQFKGQSPKVSSSLPDGTRIPLVAWQEGAGQYRGRFTDVCQAARSLLGETFELPELARIFDPSAIVGGRVVHNGRLDDESIWRLRDRLMAALDVNAGLSDVVTIHHDAGIELHRLQSVATPAKAYWKASGISRAPEVDPADHAIAAAAFKGGRVEAVILRHAVPVVVADRTAAYARDATFLGLEDLLAAERLSVVDAMAEVRRITDTDDPMTDLADAELCRAVAPVFVQVLPDGEVYCTKAFLSDRSQPSLTVAPLTADHGLWISAFEFIDARLASGRWPKVVDARRFEPHGSQERRAVSFAGSEPKFGHLIASTLDVGELGASEVDRLLRRGIKATRNSMCFGLSSQMTRLQGASLRQVVNGPWVSREIDCPPEVPGTYTCFVVASSLTAYARLMLRRVQSKVEAFGGVVAGMDTDSVAIVATQHGGLIPCPNGPLLDADGVACIPALRFEDVGNILREESWSDPTESNSSWRVEHDSTNQQVEYLAICNKRSVLFTRNDDGEITLLDPSEHVLGGRYLDPYGTDEPVTSGARRWVEEAWLHLLDPERYPEPWWWKLPAVRTVTITRPELLKRFGGAGLRIPFGKLCQAEVSPTWGGGAGPIAPYRRRPSDITEWFDASTGEILSVGLDVEADEGITGAPCIISTLGGVVTRWWATSDPRYMPANDLPDEGLAVGLRKPRPLRSTGALHELIGKESTYWGDAFAGSFDVDDENWLTTFSTLHDPDRILLGAIDRIGTTEIADRIGRSVRTIERIRSTQRFASESIRNAIREVAAAHSRSALGRSGRSRGRTGRSHPRTDLTLIAAWLSAPEEGRLCGWPKCRSAVRAKATYCSASCRAKADRSGYRQQLNAMGAVRCRLCGHVALRDPASSCPFCHEHKPLLGHQCPRCRVISVGPVPDPCPVCQQLDEKGGVHDPR